MLARRPILRAVKRAYTPVQLDEEPAVQAAQLPLAGVPLLEYGPILKTALGRWFRTRTKYRVGPHAAPLGRGANDDHGTSIEGSAQ